MYIVILNAMKTREPHWFSMWYEGSDPDELVPMYRQEARKRGETYVSSRRIPLYDDWKDLFLNLQERHGAALRMVCLHSFAFGYSRAFRKILPPATFDEIPVPDEESIASLYREIGESDLGRKMLYDFMILGTASEIKESTE